MKILSDGQKILVEKFKRLDNLELYLDQSKESGHLTVPISVKDFEFLFGLASMAMRN